MCSQIRCSGWPLTYVVCSTRAAVNSHTMTGNGHMAETAGVGKHVAVDVQHVAGRAAADSHGMHPCLARA